LVKRRLECDLHGRNPETMMKMRMRKLILCGIIIAISGLVPLAVHAGSCQDMPCCHQRGVVLTSGGECCSPATCVNEEQALESRSHSGQRHGNQLVAILPHLDPSPVASADAAVNPSKWLEGSPPTTQQRLSFLSTLLI